MKKLMIGAGVHRRHGWMVLDANPQAGGDYIATIPPLPDAVKAIKWDEIEWIHGITSLYPWDAETVLAELRSVLSPGGKLVLEQPHFHQAKERLEWIFGDAASFKNPLLMNRWAYTPESLVNALRVAGFGSCEILPAQHHKPERDFRIEALCTIAR